LEYTNYYARLSGTALVCKKWICCFLKKFISFFLGGGPQIYLNLPKEKIIEHMDLDRETKIKLLEKLGKSN
jgi:hypothetical protein